ncbi:hypothetical protein [Tuwongella immobilis]|uniref:Uncharacterized protein n=1 Tax=Tuwongella immobilis TaxID=692036 RepID=A0A6C2YHB7_9BACT|nr:hypothetical protein [Tuwongella immobilis]VIP00659.1 unnamed protein product [Tuwongella immobilis]VTR96736.1 unnamed protein product [Tuwongella immobilis]
MEHEQGQRVRDTVAMIVQFPAERIHGAMHAADMLAPLLSENGLGQYDGHDYGGGKINLFVFDIRDDDWQRAFDLVLSELASLRLLNAAVVVRSISWETDNHEWLDYTIFHPQGYDKEFSIW